MNEGSSVLQPSASSTGRDDDVGNSANNSDPNSACDETNHSDGNRGALDTLILERQIQQMLETEDDKLRQHTHLLKTPGEWYKVTVALISIVSQDPQIYSQTSSRTHALIGKRL